MSTHKYINGICIAVIICAVLLTIVFMNGSKLGIKTLVDEDAEDYTGSKYFTANDLKGDWDDTGSDVIVLKEDKALTSGGAYYYNGNVYITRAGRYIVSGEFEDGSIIINADNSAKIWLKLNGADIRCVETAPIQVEQADKVFLTVADGTENTITREKERSEEADAAGIDGAIFARDDLTINGNGKLTVVAHCRHGIAANDDLVIAGGDLTVKGPADGIHANDSIRVANATLAVTGGDDGIYVSEDKGYFHMESGKVEVTCLDDAIHATSDISIAGGELKITADDDGIHSDSQVTVSDGTINIEKCIEGIEAPIINVDGGDITIYPTDDGLNANGGDSQMQPGNMQQGPPNMEGESGEGMSPPDMEGESREGISPPDMEDESGERMSPPDMENESRGDMTQPQSDTENSSEKAQESCINISGGTITIINESGQDADGIDSNGSIYITGGTIFISLSSDDINNAIDYASESGGVCEIHGGYVVACGGYSMAEQFSQTSTQCSILYNFTQGADENTKFVLQDSEGKELLSYTVPCKYSSVNMSCPEMEVGKSYTIKAGDLTEEITLDSICSTAGDAQSGFGGMQMPDLKKDN